MQGSVWCSHNCKYMNKRSKQAPRAAARAGGAVHNSSAKPLINVVKGDNRFSLVLLLFLILLAVSPSPTPAPAKAEGDALVLADSAISCFCETSLGESAKTLALP